jgi:hypothetical protein
MSDKNAFFICARTLAAFHGLLAYHSHHRQREKDHLQTIAVMLQLVHPTRPTWRLLGDDWLTWMDEGSGRV